MTSELITPTESQLSVVRIVEPLDTYENFFQDPRVLFLANQRELPEAHSRWQVVERGGIKNPIYLPPEMPMTGWAGYLVGFSPELQTEILQYAGTDLLSRITHAAKNTGIPSEILITHLAEKKFNIRTATALEPAFYGVLTQMRAIGITGIFQPSYSTWRTNYEMQLSKLNKALRAESSMSGRIKISGEISAMEWSLQERINDLRRGRNLAVLEYEETHQTTRDAVESVYNQTKQPLIIDQNAGTISYPIPNLLGVQSTTTQPISENAPEWIIALHNIPAIGHPLIRAAIMPKNRMN